MTDCLSVQLFSEHTVTAYVFTVEERTWVGLADQPAARPKAWSRIWSSHRPLAQVEIGHFLRQLTEALELLEREDAEGVTRTTVVGHYFFAGWEYWGPGNPAPLLPSTAADYVGEAQAVPFGEMTRSQPPGEDA
ncbi:hypothetical protein [Streptomyces sedi]|uniref:Uncharacterized protein n=1 Tax=Streptomyces sedi TaxID=555059 RepID=A0A5C4V418_9ACTN|nr:hypothetical protein [Streptomyces sedi]TNM30561.1 hypothetical protein FH715_11165 [Streptomyces sedi]